ncbi:M23 family peptidase [Micromonospora endophytica]|uniref:M23 family peptidase n=2 Tax=Micromonospora endophytica TaxID=515350 RepID=A0A2W2CF87_9ACTN|nr:M23 family peptidase [Micromonospora endophytica]RIW50281.1 M23 family peptidase [Micromonospora endophytica]
MLRTPPDAYPPAAPVPRGRGVAVARGGLVLLCGLALLMPFLDPAVAGPKRPTMPTAVAGPFRWPVDGLPQPVRRFDPPPRPWLSGHRGVDLHAATGAAIRAAGAGTVLFAGPVAGRPVISVGHADGLRTTYEPVQPVVTVGAAVVAGSVLGHLLPGHAGCPATACLHWGLRQDADYHDPLALLGLGRSRLLPLGEVPAAPGRSVSAGRAARAAGRRAGHTRRPSCRPARRAAANRVRSRS